MKQLTKYSNQWESDPRFENWLQSSQKEETKAKCKWCNCEFSIAHKGKRDVETHMDSKKHKDIVKNRLTTKPATAFFSCKYFLDSIYYFGFYSLRYLIEYLSFNIANVKSIVSAQEGTYVYHMLRHNLSFRSMECTSKLMKSVFGQMDFSCSKTKSTAIITGVFDPIIMQKIRMEMEQAKFICISTDASNHKETKMFPVLVRYFLPNSGIQTRLIQFTKAPGDKAEHIFDLLEETWKEFKIQDKIIAFGGDNCPTNFGNINRTGPKNVYRRICDELGEHIIGVGCLAHMLHNAVKDST